MSESRQRYPLLLVALTVTFCFYGIAQPVGLYRAIGTALVGATLLLAFYAAKMKPPIMLGAVAVVSAAVVAVIVAAAVGKGSTSEAITAVVNGLVVALAPPVVALGVYRDLRATGRVTVIVVSGVLCLYLLFGMFFAFVYVAIQNLGGAPFFANGASAVSARAVYFSFSTLTTVGYGDYTARTNLGHTLSITEALLGQIYLVTIVAAIVGRLVPGAHRAT
jgi:Ion channel